VIVLHPVPCLTRDAGAQRDKALNFSLSGLPDDSGLEDIPYHLYVLDQVRRGLEDAGMNATLSGQDDGDSTICQQCCEKVLSRAFSQNLRALGASSRLQDENMRDLMVYSDRVIDRLQENENSRQA